MPPTKHSLPDTILAETVRRPAMPRPDPMKRLLAGLTALAAVFALLMATAAPSRADSRSDDIAKIIVGALVVGAIVNELSDDDRKAPQPVAQNRVPAACAIRIDSRESGPVTLYGGRCLRDKGFRNLPACGRSITIYGKHDQLFAPDCLRRAGFSLPRR